MGPLLIVQGPDRAASEALFASGVAAFRSLAGLEPAATIAPEPATARPWVASFPQLCARESGLYRGDGGWMSAAGTMFFRRRAGRRALEDLAAASAGATLTGLLCDVDGIFALAMGGAGDELTLVTDRLGSLHLYLAKSGSCLLASTSSMVLAALLRPEWDLIGCRHFLATGTVFENRTLFTGIKKLEPATVFCFRGARLYSKEKYWNVAAVMHDRAPKPGDAPALAEALTAGMRTIADNFQRPLLDLTGGYDSRALLGAMLAAGCDFATVVNGAPGSPDVRVANRIAAEFGLRHRHQDARLAGCAQVWEAAKASLPLTDGEYDVLLYHSVSHIHRLMAAEFDLSVNGSNGEICKGYWWELLAPFTGWKGHFDARRVAARRFVFDGEELGLLAQPFGEQLADHFAGIIERANAPLASHPNTAKLDHAYLALRMQRWQGRLASATLRLWPVVSPFAFREPMEAALAVPPRRRVRHRLSRRLIEHLNPRLAALPLEHGYPALPLRWNTWPSFWPLATDAATRALRPVRRLLGFVPLLVSPAAKRPPAEFWQLEEVRALLDPTQMISRDLYNPAVLRRFLVDSQRPDFPQAARFGRIVTLELLARAVLGC